MSTRDDYTGTGSTTDFTITFDYKEMTSIVVVYLNGVKQTIDVDYTIVEITTVRFTTAPALNDAIVIQRESDFTQRPNAEKWKDTGRLSAAAHNLEDDFSLFRDQEIKDRLGLPLALSGRFWTAEDPDNSSTYLKISNLKDPEAAQDAVTLNYLQDYVSGGSTGISGVQRQQHDGDGITKTFNVVTSGEGQISDKDLVVAYVGERILEPSEYSVASNGIDVTFTDPPGDGERIDIWVVTAAISSIGVGEVLPNRLSLTQNYLITGDASNQGSAIARSALLISELGKPTANVDWNSKKITSLANGAASSDAAAFGQIATAITAARLSTAGTVATLTFTGSSPSVGIENSKAYTAFYVLTQSQSANYGSNRRIEIEIDDNSGFTSAQFVAGMTLISGNQHRESCAFAVPAGWFWRAKEIDSRALGSSSFKYQTIN